ncbi:MAG: HAD family hydrolase [Ruminiclostridium sp.]|nr:HAD family hydrolase [Ruminiclostridium sp.]
MAKIFEFSNEYNGLDDEKVRDNTELYGYNSDTKLDEKEKGYSPIQAFVDLRFFIMLAAAAISLWHGVITKENSIPEICAGIVLLLLCGFYAASEIVKNTYCDKYFFKLKDRSKAEYRIVRGGELRGIRREHIVPDDILVLEAGESVPADAHLLEIKELTVDESILTGSKEPVKKITGADNVNEEFKRSCIYKGTKILTGQLVARVTATGVDTKLFKQYGAVREAEVYYTSLEKLVMRVSGIFTAIAAVMLVAAAFTFIRVSVNIPFYDTIYNAFWPAAAFALCFIPAETASIIRLYYIKGSQKLEEKGIWVKNLRTVEYINAVTCILIDKNGMVTKKNMQVADTLTANETMLSNVSVLACGRTPDDPFDQAIILNASFKGQDTAELTSNECLKEYAFDESEGAAGNLWIVGGARLLCIKGNPEKLLPLCDVPNDMLYTVQNKMVSYAQTGYNVLAVAYATLPTDAEIPERIGAAHYNFMGLIAFEEQTKDYIPAAIIGCRKAGARVIMTTGDSAETALAVAKKIGIKGDKAVTGDMLAEGGDIDLDGVGVFARITYDMKRDIIRRLQDAGEVVMITGESATDSDLLELADVGVSLASRVTGAAFEECDVIVNNDSFETAKDILGVARQSHMNIKRCISTAITALLALAGFAVFNFFIGTQPVVSPVIGALLTTVAVPLAAFMFFENTADLRTMTEPSVFIGRGRLRKGFFVRPLLQAIGIGAAEIIYYLISSGYNGTDAPSADGLTELSRSGFLLLFVFGILFTCLANLSDRGIIGITKSGNTMSWLISGCMLAGALALVFVPYVNSAFGLASPEILTLLVGIALTLIFQLPAELIGLSLKKLKE